MNWKYGQLSTQSRLLKQCLGRCLTNCLLGPLKFSQRTPKHRLLFTASRGLSRTRKPFIYNPYLK